MPRFTHHPSPASAPGWWGRILHAGRAHLGRVLAVGLVFLVMSSIFLVDGALAEPLRRWAQNMMNSELQGYKVHIVHLRPHLWRLGLDLDQLTLVQARHPDPPVADFGALRFSLAWEKLFHFRMAGDLTLVRPDLHIDRAQLQEEVSSKVKFRDQGWQRAIESIYPFKLERVQVQDGSLLYLAAGTESKPLRLTHVSMAVRNVRNIAAVKDTYPSPVSLDGAMFDTGRIHFQGAADFLRQPFTAVKGEIRLERVPFDRLAPLAKEYQLKTREGYLSLHGNLEYTPEIQTVHLAQVLLQDLDLDYVTSPATHALEAEHAREVVRLARQIRNRPKLLLRVDSLKVSNGQVGFVDEMTPTPYRLFISKGWLDLQNLSNQAKDGNTEFHVRGEFMGSGPVAVSGRIRSIATPVDLDLHLTMEDVQLPALNGLLHAHSEPDVDQGQLSVYAELTVKDGKLDGYVKPLIKNLKVYDRQEDRHKAFGKRMELHAIQLLAEMLKNHRTQELATVVRLSGSTSHPKVSEWEAIRGLIGNGLLRAVRPGFLAPRSEPLPRPGDARVEH